MSKNVFEETVLSRLSAIEDRLISIEDSLTGIGDFASDIISDESGPLNAEVLESLKSTLNALSAPIESAVEAGVGASEGMSFHEVLGSLSEFKERIAGIREVMSEQTKAE